MYIGRKLGWMVSKPLYRCTWLALLFLLPIWGALTALGFHLLLSSFQPGWLARILGFGMAVYVAIPNYGLFRADDLPIEFQARHAAIAYSPLFAFVCISSMLAFV